MTSRRRVLAILRAGDASLHPGWLTGASPQNRNWDLHLSYFGDRTAPFPDRPADVTLSPADVTLSFEKGTKAIGTVACIRKLADRIWSYDWVWLPDDGLAAELGVLNRFFEIIEQFELDLAQPALGAGSYVSHDITRQRPHMALRFTTFVDIMAACFSRCAEAMLALPRRNGLVLGTEPPVPETARLSEGQDRNRRRNARRAYPADRQRTKHRAGDAARRQPKPGAAAISAAAPAHLSARYLGRVDAGSRIHN